MSANEIISKALSDVSMENQSVDTELLPRSETITAHCLPGVWGDGLAITAIYQSDDNGVCNHYVLKGGEVDQDIVFQHGNAADKGINGVTVESLIAIAAHRLKDFQKGDMACKDTATAIEHLEAALGQLIDRMQRRVNLGVVGQNVNPESQP
jgi:hypothetical protein